MDNAIYCTTNIIRYRIDHNKSEFQYLHGELNAESICIVSETLYLLKTDVVQPDDQPNK